MVQYKCNRCNKIFTHKNDYNKHKNRKKPCKISVINSHKSSHKNECSKCHKIYANRSNLNRHTKNYCTFKIDNKNYDYFEESIEKDIDTDDIGGVNDGSNYVYDDQEITILKKPHKPHKTSQKKVRQSVHVCGYCKKEFTRYDNLMRHKNKYCKVRKKNDEEMAKLLNRLVKEMEDLKKTNKKLQTDMGNIKGNTKTTHTNSHNTQNTTNVQNNINLLSFGNDNMKNISNEEIKKILKRGFKSIQLMTKKTNFDPDIPENHNVYINNIKSQYAITYNKGKWELDRVENVIDRIYDDKYGFLERKYYELKNELKPYDRKKIERILDEYEGVKESEIFGEIRLILYNNRHIPLKTRNAMNDNNK